MQLFHGVASSMRESAADFVFAPILRSTLRVVDEPHARVCPIVQSAPFLLRHDLAHEGTSQWLSPEIEIGPRGLESQEFRASCMRLAQDLGAVDTWEPAYRDGLAAQSRFVEECEAIGRRALQFCREHDVTPVVVLGRPYTIYNPILNSSVPSILREQGTLAIPVDCYPVDDHVPVFQRIYWGYAQRLLRAAHEIRRTPGIYSVYCSNYSCGPDSFNLHFFSYVMQGKPFAVIETDGHTGDAGTKTRIEAFLHCVAQDRAKAEQSSIPRDLPSLTKDTCDFANIDKQNETVLVPWMGPCSEIGAACLRSAGFNAEALAQCDRNALHIGRRYTSGKECVPISLTLGRLIDKLQSEPDRRFAFLMPRTNGPCRLGLYHLLQKIVIEEFGARDRCRFVSPNETDYLAGLPKGFTVLLLSGIVAHDLLHEALLLVRPDEKVRGAANQIHARRTRELCQLLASQQRIIQSPVRALTEVLTGRLFGVPRLLREAAKDFAAMPRTEVPGDGSRSVDRSTGDLPVVLLVGEIYVRHDPFANDDIITRLESRGMRVRFAPLNGWFEYVGYCNSQFTPPTALDKAFDFLKKRVEHAGWQAMAKHLPITEPIAIAEMVHAASDYLAGDVGGEAVLTLGHPLHDWRQGTIDAAVNVGPLECMPTRITESQFFHAAEREGLPTLTLTFNGDPLPDEALDNFAFEVHARYRQRKAQCLTEAQKTYESTAPPARTTSGARIHPFNAPAAARFSRGIKPRLRSPV